MQIRDLQQWIGAWKNVTEILLWGSGKNCKLHFQEIAENYRIEAIVDNDRQKERETISGISIVSPDHVDLINKKIVITTHYEEVSEQLKDMGLKEYIDFCDMRVLVSAGNWYYHKKLVLSEVHIALTTACTLNCKFCNMYMPFHKKQTLILSLEEVEEQLNLLFTFVDRVTNLVLLGGEPFLYADLGKVITYISERYKKKVQNVEVVTNGTILPERELLDVLKDNHVLVSLSNYCLGDSYNSKFEKMRQLLEENHIKYYINSSLQWKNFGFPYEELNLTDQQAYENMNLCNPVFRGFNDSKFYFCHLVWSAAKAGIHDEKETDYIDFKKMSILDREKIVQFNICCMDEEYVSLCRKCGGCSNLNQKYVPVGQQM